MMQIASDVEAQTMDDRSRRRVVLDVCVQTALTLLGMGIVVPVLPIYASSFHINFTLTGIIITAFGVARIFVNIPAGRLTERVGYRGLLIAGPLILCFGAALNGMATGFWTLLMSRLIEGAGSALYTTTAMSYLAQISPAHERGHVMGYHQGSILIGASLGPIFGGYLSDHLGFRAPFFIYGAVVGCGALWTYWRMKERNGRRQERLPGKAEAERDGRKVKLLEIIFEPNLMLANLVTFAVFFTRAGAQLMIIPLFGYGVAALTSSQVGTALTCASLLNLVTMFTSGKQTQRFGRKRMIVVGAAVSALSLVFFPFLAHGLWSYLICTIFYGLGTGIVVPALAAYVVDTPATAGRYGIAMGVYRTYGDVGYILAPMLMGWLGDVTHGYVWPLLSSGLIMALASALFWAKGVESTHQPVRVEQLPLS